MDTRRASMPAQIEAVSSDSISGWCAHSLIIGVMIAAAQDAEERRQEFQPPLVGCLLAVLGFQFREPFEDERMDLIGQLGRRAGDHHGRSCRYRGSSWRRPCRFG